MKHCTNCGAELQPHWKFCPNCQAAQPASGGNGSESVEAPNADEEAPTAGVTPEAPIAPEAPKAPKAPEAPKSTEAPEAPKSTEAPEATVAPEAPKAAETAALTPGQPTQRFAKAPEHAPKAGPAPAGGPAASTSVFDPPAVAPGAGDFSDSNNGGVPGGPAGGPASGEAPKKRSRKTIILAAVLIVVLGLGIGAYFFVQNMLRGGAGSPEAAADKLLESMEAKDVVGLVGMVPPDEREPFRRLQEHLEDKFEEFGIEEAIAESGRDEELDSDELTFDGVEVTFEGVDPEISEIDDNTALITYGSGEVRLQVDPDATTGRLRSFIEAGDLEDEEKIDETAKLSELGPDDEPMTLVATKRDGRWYVSPVYSIMELVNEGEGYGRGSATEPDGGSDSPVEAAKAMVESVPGVLSEGSIKPLADSLSVHEGGLLYLYEEMFDDMLSEVSGEELEIKDVRFTEGAEDGDRAVAVVENIALESEYGDKITLTKDCIKGERESDSVCLNGSGYAIEPSAQMIGGLGEFSFTTVKEDGKWRVSMGETMVDWVIKWTDSLTREQAIAMLQLASADDTSGKISVDEETEVKFNSAGYAVLELTVEEDMALAAEDEYDFGDITVYSADGKEEITTLGYGDEIPAGDYKLLVFAGMDWDEEFAEEGSNPDASAELTVVEDAGYSIGSVSAKDSIFGLLPLGSDSQVHAVAASDSDTELVFEVTGSAGPNTDPLTVVVTLDGKKHEVQVASQNPGTLTLPYPGDGKEHELEVELMPGTGYEYAFLSYSADLM